MATQAQIEAIDKAIASGERVVQYDGKRIEYRSIDELIKARDILVKGLPAAAGFSSGAGSILANRVAVAEFTRD